MVNSEYWKKLKAETDGAAQRIHFNNAGSALPPNAVRDAVISYFQEESELGGYETHRKHNDTLEATYDSIARLIHADREEIAIVENATVAWNAAFQAIDFEDGDEIITNEVDYASNYLSYLHHIKDLNIKVVPNNSAGDFDLEVFASLINEKTKLVAITHMPTNSGHVAPAEAIGEVCKKYNTFYLLDACQSVGQYPVDVKRIKCDMLSATGRKYLRAPRGTGFLFVGSKVMNNLKPQWVDLHSAEWTGPDSYKVRTDARKFENWEGNRAAQVGLKVAADYAMNIGLVNIWERVQELSKKLREQLAELDHVTVHDMGTIKSGLVSFTVKGYTALEVQNLLFEKHINVSWNGTPNTYLDMDKRGLTEIVRASVHYYNSEEEVRKFISALIALKK